MAVEPLFNWQDIDRSQVAVTPERIGELNPQSGPMRQLDHLIWVNDTFDQVVGVKQVGQDEFWVPHHIPGRPLFPGVLMIEAGAQLSSVLFHLRHDRGAFLGFTRCNNVTFRTQVLPGDTLYLIGNQKKYNPRRMVCDVQGWVNETMAFEVEITGMVV